MDLLLYRITLIFLFLISFEAPAELFNTNEVIDKSGKTLELSEDEGYVLISVSTDTDLRSISFRNDKYFSKRVNFKNVREGENFALIKLKAGQYYLHNIYVSYNPYFAYSAQARFKKDRHPFEVKAGVINYPGTWNISYEQINFFYYRIFTDIENRSSFEFSKLMKKFQKQLPDLKFHYNNKAIDSYADYLNQVINNQKLLTVDDLHFNTDKDKDLPIILIKDISDLEQINSKYPDLKKYLLNKAQLSGGINESGEYFLFGAEIEESTVIGVADTDTFEIKILMNEKFPEGGHINNLQWIDTDTIHYELSFESQEVDMIAHLLRDGNSQLQGVKHIKIPRSGHVHSAVKGRDNHLYFTSWVGRNAHRNLQLFQVDVSNEKSIKKSLKRPLKQLKKLKNMINYLLDKDGVIRAAVTMEFDKKEEKTLYHYWFLRDKNSKDWLKIKTLSEDDDPFLLNALSSDGTYFYVITDQFGDKSAIHKFSSSDLSHLGLVYEDDDYEIKKLIIDNNTDELKGYGYVNQGVYQMKYFDQNDDRVADMRNSELNFHAYVSQYVKSSNQLLVFGITPTNKGAWYLKDLTTNKVEKLFNLNPDYEQLPKGNYHHVKTKANDGLEIEGFLILPKVEEGAQIPLVVIPHGGPIGVRDLAYNDSVQQFFASQGIATLKVNYRGSSGYGKKFMDEGKGQWGEKIEQDIHAVVQKVIESWPINQSKICAMGGSYGGYSAVMLTALYPDMYQCAVSWAGVMDLPLVFSNTLYNLDDERIKRMAEIIGDPIVEHEKLRFKSPVYIAEKLNKPMLLIQGMQDYKVEYEHAMRMQQMALLFDLDFELILFVNEGHSFSSVDAQIQHVARSIDFIKEKLELK